MNCACRLATVMALKARGERSKFAAELANQSCCVVNRAFTRASTGILAYVYHDPSPDVTKITQITFKISSD